jgi:hypothetical protein
MCPEKSGDSLAVGDVALGGGLSSIGLPESSPPATSISDASLFLVALGEDEVGDSGCSSFLVRSAVGLDVGAERVSLIRLLLRKFLEGFESSIGDSGEASSACMIDLTYRLGTWKKVATGVWGEEGVKVRTIGGET